MGIHHPKPGPTCDYLAALRYERQKAVEAVVSIGMHRALNMQSQSIYARLTMAHKAEVKHRLECSKCRQTLNAPIL